LWYFELGNLNAFAEEVEIDGGMWKKSVHLQYKEGQERERAGIQRLASIEAAPRLHRRRRLPIQSGDWAKSWKYPTVSPLVYGCYSLEP